MKGATGSLFDIPGYMRQWADTNNVASTNKKPALLVPPDVTLLELPAPPPNGKRNSRRNVLALDTVIERLEQIVRRIGIMDDFDRVLSRAALKRLYLLDLIDRITVRLYMLHAGIRELYLFHPDRHHNTYPRSALLQAWGDAPPHDPRAEDSGTALEARGFKGGPQEPLIGELCELLRQSRVVAEVPRVKMHLNQREADEVLKEVFVPLERLKAPTTYAGSRYVVYANSPLPFLPNGMPIFRDGMSFASDLVRLVSDLEFVPLDEVCALLRASEKLQEKQEHVEMESLTDKKQGPMVEGEEDRRVLTSSASGVDGSVTASNDPRNLIYLLDAMSIKLVEDNQQLLRLACVATADSKEFLLGDLTQMALEQQLPLPDSCDKDQLCELLTRNESKRGHTSARENPFLRLRIDR